ncbi:MAG: hypothetical protein PHD80_03935 [Candidatus ainarchaeum sp.]|nr:hypothetical protein [Candidatus ainarchaeum sp.]
MTNAKWSKLIGVFVVVFAIIIPLATTFLSYISLEETTSAMSMNIIGVFVAIGVLIGAIKLIKKRIKMKKEIGLIVNPYLVSMPYLLPAVISPLLFTWLIWAIKAEINTLANVMVIISICAIIAFVLKLIQLHFDLKIVAENNTTV